MEDSEKIKIILEEGWQQSGDFWIAPDDEHKDNLLTLKKAWKYHRQVERGGEFFGICDIHQKMERVSNCMCGGQFCDSYSDSDDHYCCGE